MNGLARRLTACHKTKCSNNTTRRSGWATPSKRRAPAIKHPHKTPRSPPADLRRPGRPPGAFLLAGPSGVGKTETVSTAGRTALRRSPVPDHHQYVGVSGENTVSTPDWFPPGYVGYGEGGVLTEAIRQKPYSVVLLDEVWRKPTRRA
ncbi:AAA family ATPase [Salmonella enterica subsp. enterica]|nr:AAA family ATPase [Salmonella enterica subsp. enterica]